MVILKYADNVKVLIPHIVVISNVHSFSDCLVPANDIALKCGNPKAANMVMLAAYVEATGIVTFETLYAMLENDSPGRKPSPTVPVSSVQRKAS